MHKHSNGIGLLALKCLKKKKFLEPRNKSPFKL